MQSLLERPGRLCTQESLASALHLLKEMRTPSACFANLLLLEKNLTLNFLGSVLSWCHTVDSQLTVSVGTVSLVPAMCGKPFFLLSFEVVFSSEVASQRLSLSLPLHIGLLLYIYLLEYNCLQRCQFLLSSVDMYTLVIVVQLCLILCNLHGQ